MSLLTPNEGVPIPVPPAPAMEVLIPTLMMPATGDQFLTAASLWLKPRKPLLLVGMPVGGRPSLQRNPLRRCLPLPAQLPHNDTQRSPRASPQQ